MGAKSKTKIGRASDARTVIRETNERNSEKGGRGGERVKTGNWEELHPRGPHVLNIPDGASPKAPPSEENATNISGGPEATGPPTELVEADINLCRGRVVKNWTNGKTPNLWKEGGRSAVGSRPADNLQPVPAHGKEILGITN